MGHKPPYIALLLRPIFPISPQLHLSEIFCTEAINGPKTFCYLTLSCHLRFLFLKMEILLYESFIPKRINFFIVTTVNKHTSHFIRIPFVEPNINVTKMMEIYTYKVIFLPHYIFLIQSNSYILLTFVL